MKAGLRIVLSTALFLFSSAALAAPEKEYWSFWDKSNEANRQQIDHSEWQTIIDKYLRYSEKYGMYLFVYGGVGKEGQSRLQRYLKSMSAMDPRTLRKKEQLAYWINLYNALTVELILKNYPVKSITRLGKGWFRTGPWKDSVIEIQGQRISSMILSTKLFVLYGILQGFTMPLTAPVSVVLIWLQGSILGARLKLSWMKQVSDLSIRRKGSILWVVDWCCRKYFTGMAMILEGKTLS